MRARPYHLTQAELPAESPNELVGPISDAIDRSPFPLDDKALLLPLDFDVAPLSQQQKAERNHARMDAFSVIRGIYLPKPEVTAKVLRYRLPPAKRRIASDKDPGYVFTKQANEYRLLTDREVYPLFMKIETGLETIVRLDASAQEATSPEQEALLEHTAAYSIMLHTNLRLPLDVVRQKFGGLFKDSLHWLDILQAGVEQLDRAVQLFDYREGTKFSTFAVPVIENGVKRYIANHVRTIRMPTNIDDRYKKAARCAYRLSSRLNHEPTTLEIALAAEMPEAEVAELLLRGNYSSPSIDKLVGENKTNSWRDMLADPEASNSHQRTIEQNEAAAAIERLFKKTAEISETAKVVIALRNGIPYNPPADTILLSAPAAVILKENVPSRYNKHGLSYGQIAKAVRGLTAVSAQIIEAEAMTILTESPQVSHELATFRELDN